MGIKSYIRSTLLPIDTTPHNTGGSDSVYSYYQRKQPDTSTFLAPPRNTMDSQESTFLREPYTPGKVTGSGVFSLAGNVQYDFLVQKFKHKKECKKQEGTEMQDMSGSEHSRTSFCF